MNLLVPLGIAAGLGTAYVIHERKKKDPTKLLGAGAAGAGTAYRTASTWTGPMSVHDVQHALNLLGAKPALDEDGVAGPKTVSAVKSFQGHAGITVDGVVGPETTAALEHALAGAGKQIAAGAFDLEGPWFPEIEDDDGDEQDEECVFFEEETDPGDDVVIVSGRGGYDESSNDWAGPDVSQIMADPAQMQQIGLQELWKQKAEAAFGPGTSAGYDYSFLPDGGAGAAQYAAQELGGDSLGGVYMTSGDFDEDGDDDGDDDDGDVSYVSGDDWSAPDIEEAYEDPEQVAEMWGMQAQAYGQPMWGYAPPQPSVYGAPVAGTYPYGPYNEPLPAPLPAAQVPGTYPYGPWNMPGFAAAPAPMAGGVPVGAGTVVPGQGYEFQSQAGRRY